MPWGLQRAVARRFPHPAVRASDPVHIEQLEPYLAEMLEPYALRLTAGPGAGQSYGEMAVALLPEEPVDVLVLAYDIPDIAPGRATAVYLSSVCPGDPMAFAVSDQGPAGAHTALRLLRDYARSGTYERALLVIAEQSLLPYDPGLPVRLPAAHVTVAVHLGPSTSEAAVPRVLADVDLADVPGLLGDPGQATLILGAALADLDVKAEAVVLADPQQPMTGVWEALAGVEGPVVLADYDPHLRYLCVSAFGS